MDKKEITLLNYKNLLEALLNQECHLLLGNGFNQGLGIDTSYKAIFQKMTENDHGIYKAAQNIIEGSNYDLEKFIGRLSTDIKNENTFLKNYINNKVKYDFMKAAHEIVKHEIKNIYAEKNEGIYMLFKNFNNYFTLNYDSFLYLLLLNLKSSDTDAEQTIAIQPTLKFIEEDMNDIQNNIYTEIKKARQNGTLDINAGDNSNSVSKQMSELTKTHFVAAIKTYSKSQNKNWKTSDIERVVKSILEEEKKNKTLDKVDDGSQLSLFGDTKEFVFDAKNETQNLFFLHGAFHIYKDGKVEKKITQTSDKALYDRLEEIINSEEKDIICVFQAANKIDEINKSEYLKKSYNKLAELSGALVIIGCSLSNNDSHIYKQINSSDVNTIYISSKEKSKTKDYENAKKCFNGKEIILFDRETITYKLQSIDDFNGSAQ